MKIADYRFGEIRDYSSLVAVRVWPQDVSGISYKERQNRLSQLLGIVLVYESKYQKALWKMPGGHQTDEDYKAEDPPLATAMRELRGETGLHLPVGAFTGVARWPGYKNTHWKVLFVADCPISVVPQLNSCDPENEGEEARYFTLQDYQRRLLSQRMVLPEHAERLAPLLFAP